MNSYIKGEKTYQSRNKKVTTVKYFCLQLEEQISDTDHLQLKVLKEPDK